MEYKTNTLEFYILTLHACVHSFKSTREFILKQFNNPNLSDGMAVDFGEMINVCTTVIQVLGNNLKAYQDAYPGILKYNEEYTKFVIEEWVRTKPTEFWEYFDHILKKREELESLIQYELKKLGVTWSGGKSIELDGTLKV